MGLYQYSTQPMGMVSKAQAYDLDASYKDLTQVCAAIKHKLVPQARQILEKCIDLEHAILYTNFNKHLGHRSELGGRQGRYPRKEARMVLEVLKNAAANASYKGQNADDLVISHAAAYKQNQMPRYRHHWAGGTTLGYGKQNLFANYVTARVELVLSPASEKTLSKRTNKKTRTKTGRRAPTPKPSASEKKS